MQREGARIPVSTVQPGEDVDAEFRAKDMVVFTNRSKTRAQLSVRLNRSPGELAMRYEAVTRDTTPRSAAHCHPRSLLLHTLRHTHVLLKLSFGHLDRDVGPD